MAGDNKVTTNHDVIKKWAETRNGTPAKVKGTGENSRTVGILRFNFPGYSQQSLEKISWDEFFETFDGKNLALLFQEKTRDGDMSRFSKFINRDHIPEDAQVVGEA